VWTDLFLGRKEKVVVTLKERTTCRMLTTRKGLETSPVLRGRGMRGGGDLADRDWDAVLAA